MCSHNSMTKKIEELASRYGRKTDIVDAAREIIESKYDISVFTWPRCPIITNAEEIQLYHWGLIPFWIKSKEEADKIKLRTYNARADSLFEKPSYREPAKARRCLIPSTGFFEWRHENGKKIPYFIYLKNEELFSLAGIYDIWRNPETGEDIYTYSMITTQANPMMEYIHNAAKRMPAILSRADEEKWLDLATSRNELETLLLPYNEKYMEAYPVNNNFIRKSPDDPSILERRVS